MLAKEMETRGIIGLVSFILGLYRGYSPHGRMIKMQHPVGAIGYRIEIELHSENEALIFYQVPQMSLGIFSSRPDFDQCLVSFTL